jgi:hypothetical protein
MMFDFKWFREFLAGKQDNGLTCTLEFGTHFVNLKFLKAIRKKPDMELKSYYWNHSFTYEQLTDCEVDFKTQIEEIYNVAEEEALIDDK